VLPFTGLLAPRGVAVDSSGNVYVADQNGVEELAAGATASVRLPFSIGQPQAVAVDSTGAVYLADQTRGPVWKLPAGSNTPTKLSFDGLKCGDHDSQLGSPIGLALDGAGTLYVADGTCQGRVLALPAGSSTPTVLPFTGLTYPSGVAVDGAGDVFVGDAIAFGNNGRVLKLAAGTSRPAALPFATLNTPGGLAADAAGDLYVAESGANKVWKLAAGSSTPVTLPFTDINRPNAVAVDGAGNVYVTDGKSRVIKLAGG
jgi:DNA-binding beta-propeller fold protein YncE